jgi:predicted membrane protein
MRVLQLQKCRCLLKTHIHIILYCSKISYSPLQDDKALLLLLSIILHNILILLLHILLLHLHILLFLLTILLLFHQNPPQLASAKKEGTRDVWKAPESLNTVKELDLGKSHSTSITCKDAKWDELNIDIATIVGNFLEIFNNINTRNRCRT